MKGKMEDNIGEKMEYDIFVPRLRILYGILAITFGIISGIVTYKYVFPLGSIMLILSGIIFIFWKRWNRMICHIMTGVIGKEIK